MKYQAHDVMEMFVAQFSGFQKYWDEHLMFWKGEECGLCSKFMPLVSYAFDLLMDISDETNGNTVERLFGIIEQLMIDGDEEVQTAVATCFIESLSNRISNRNPSINDEFLSRLGSVSREYCEAFERHFNETGCQG